MKTLHSLLLAVVAFVAATAAVERRVRPEASGPVVWEGRRSGAVIIQVTRDGERFNVTVRPENIYQQVAWSVVQEDGADVVRVRQWEVSETTLTRPAKTWGLRDLDSLREYYRVRYEFFGKDGRRLTIYEGSGGWLVRVVTIHSSGVPGE